MQDWDTRMRVTQPAFRVREPLLTMRRTVLDLLNDATNTDVRGRITGFVVQKVAPYLNSRWSSACDVLDTCAFCTDDGLARAHSKCVEQRN